MSDTAIEACTADSELSNSGIAQSVTAEAAESGTPRRRLPEGLRSAAPAFAIALAASLALIALLGFDLWRNYRAIEAQAFEQSAGLVALLESHIEHEVTGIDDMLAAFGERVRLRDAGGPFDGASLGALEDEGKLLLQSLSVGGLALLDGDGRVVVSTILPRGLSLQGADYVTAALASSAEESFLGKALRGPVSGKLLLPLSRPVRRADGSLIGIVVTTLDPDALVSSFQSRPGNHFSVVIIAERDGTIVVRSPPDENTIGSQAANGLLVEKFLPAAPAGSVRFQGRAGRERMMSYASIQGAPLVVSALLFADDVFAPWYKMLRTYMAFAAALILAVLCCAWLMGRDLARRRALTSARRVRAIIDDMAGFVAMLSIDGRFLEINRGPLDRAKLDRAKVLGRPLWETGWCAYSSAIQAKAQSLIRRAATGQTVREDMVVRQGPERLRTMDLTIHRVIQPDGQRYLIASGTDVTEQRQLEEQLRQSQKMEALGLMAGGIAHDFNNLLAAIAQFAQFLTDDLEKGSAQHAFADRIRKACVHGKDIVGQVLTYARPDAAPRATVDLVEVLTAVRELVNSSKAAAVSFECTLAEDSDFRPSVLANRAQLTQIVLNLCINAVDALEDGRGVVRLALEEAAPGDHRHPLRPLCLAEPDCRYRSRPPQAGRRYARITVRDTGCGMEQAVLQRIFDPFYTTKSRGRGTGLGLAVVHSIVNALDGIVEVESTRGDGTIFAIYLPISELVEHAATPIAARAPSLGGHERILIVEDDADLADGLAIGLKRAGYGVAIAGNSQAALQAMTEAPGGWELVISDYNLPGMTGLELIRRIHALQPNIPAILHTGISDPVSIEGARQQGVHELVRKPADPAQLAATVRAVLDRAKAR